MTVIIKGVTIEPLVSHVQGLLIAMEQVVKGLPDEEKSKFKESPQLYVASYLVSLERWGIDAHLKILGAALEKMPLGPERDQLMKIANYRTRQMLECAVIDDSMQSVLTDSLQK